MDIQQRLNVLGVGVPELLLPGPGVDLSKWAVIACDQYTQDRSYWDSLDRTIGEAPSTLRLIYPEAYLEDSGRGERIKAIHSRMNDYLRDGVFTAPRRAFMYLERATPWNPRRRGLLLAVDLERYDWAPDTFPLIRATEGTVPERIPPRMELRRGAALESPHILLLMDDEEDTLLPALGRLAKAALPLYDTPLEPASGHIAGWALENAEAWETLASGLESLFERSKSRYPAKNSPFLFAVGDGNHSLATAKAVWEEYKKAHAGEPGLENHPARWALAELENLYDPGINFEPIHRIISGKTGVAEPSLKSILALLSSLPGFTSRRISSKEELSRLTLTEEPGLNRLGLASKNDYALVETSAPGLATGFLQPLLDSFATASSLVIDYIHGEEELLRLAASENRVGILLPRIRKNGLFETVARSGPLPRKSFSLGEAPEKRFYLECRRLFSQGTGIYFGSSEKPTNLSRILPQSSTKFHEGI
jgi:hypothetical protein